MRHNPLHMAAAVQIIQSAAAAEKLLKPERLRMLERLASEPGSATSLAKVLEMPRQTVNLPFARTREGRLR
jgi:hypothetical protein